MGDDYMATTLMTENSELKKKLLSLEEKNLSLTKSMKQAPNLGGFENI